MMVNVTIRIRMTGLFCLPAAALILQAAGAGASECDSAATHPEWVFCHDFEAADADAFDNYWDDIYGAGDRMFLIDENPVGVEGSRSMRLQVVNDTDTEFSEGVTSGPKKFLGAVVDWDSLYYRRYMRFNADFHQGDFMHLGGMSACRSDLYPWGCMGHAGERPPGDERYSSNLEPWSDYQTLPWPGRWGFYSYYYMMYMDCGFPGPDDCYGDMFSPTEDSFISRGEWHVLEMVIDPGTPGEADGSQTFWSDGVKIYTAEGIAWRTTPDLRPNEVGVYLYIHNNPARTTNILDIDNVVISRSYIGPAPCREGAQIAAPCLCGGAPDPEDSSNVFSTGTCCSWGWQDGPCSDEPPDIAEEIPDAGDGAGEAAEEPPDGAEGRPFEDGLEVVDGPATDAQEETPQESGGCGCRIPT